MTTAPAQPSLRRSLGLAQGTAMTVGAVLGAGILVLPALTAELSGPASVVAWLLMCVLALPLCLTLGRLAVKQPDAGGVLAYARRAFGDRYARALGWVLLGSIPLGAPVAALVGANYIGRLLDFSHGQVAATACMMMAVVVILNVRGIQLSAAVQVLVVVAIIVLLLVAVVGASGSVRRSNFAPFSPHGWGSVISAAGLIFYSFAGWEMIVPLAEEFRRPKRDLPLSLLLAAGVIFALYMSVVVVTVGTRAYAESTTVAPLSLLVRMGFGSSAETATVVFALFITFGTAHANTAGYSRILYSQGRDGDLPRGLARIHPEYRTPVGALAVLSGIFAAVLGYYWIAAPSLGTLVRWPSVVFVFDYIMVMAAAMRLFHWRDSGWWLATISILVCIVVYAFSGWMALFPLALAGAGLLHRGVTDTSKKPSPQSPVGAEVERRAGSVR